MKILIVFGTLSGLAFGAITGARVTDVSNTQAFIRYTAPDNAACTIQVSEDPSLSPLVNDVNASMFAGSDSDSRAGNLSPGRSRVFVVGHRGAAERALDGFWRSRALQVSTTHYYAIHCGADTATGEFATANLAPGNTWNDPYPGDPAAGSLAHVPLAGAYAWPEFTSWTDRTETVIDPQRGVLLKRMTLPLDHPDNNSPSGDHAFAAARGTNWTNAGNVLVDDTLSATYAAATQDFLFVQANIAIRRNLLVDYESPDYITVGLKAWASTGTGADLDLEACITVNGVSCWPSNATAKFQTVTLGTSSLPSSFVTLGTAVPVMDAWTPAGYQGLSRVDLAARSGFGGTYTANVAVGGVATMTGNTVPFPLAWTAGSHITIAGQDCALSAAGTSRETVTINTGSCSLSLPLTAATWSASNVGWLIRKKTTTTNQINIQYAKYTYQRSHTAAMPSSGSVRLCDPTASQNTVTMEYGYRCMINDAGVTRLYWIGGTTGTVNYLGLPSAGFAGGPDGWDTAYLSGIPPDGNRLDFVTSDHTGKPIYVSCTLASTNQAGSLTVSSCANQTLSSAGHDLASLTAAFTSGDTPSYDATHFGAGLVGRQDSKLFLNGYRNGQDTYGWHMIFDRTMVSNAAGCVGGVLPGCIVAAQSSWGHAPARFCELHTSFVTWTGPKVWIAGKFFSGGNVGSGPYTTTVTSGAMSATPAVAAGSGSCPAGSDGCDNITVTGDVCNAGNDTGETLNCPTNGAHSYLGPMQVGDVLLVGSEKLSIVTRTDAQHWLVERGWHSTAASHSSSATLTAQCSSPSGYWNQNSTYISGWDFGTSNWSWSWDFVADPHGTGSGVAIVNDYDHPAPRETTTLGFYGISNQNLMGGGLEVYGVADGLPIDSGPNRIVAGDGRVNGASGSFGSETAQDHAGRNQTSDAPVNEQKWLADARSLKPDASYTVGGVATLVNGQLYKFTSTTSDGDNLTLLGGHGNLNRKRAPTIAYCGAQAMIDISSAATGDIIPTDSTGAYKYCGARKASECRASSAIGDVYANCPAAVKLSGSYGCGPVDQADEPGGNICVLNASYNVGTATQVGYPRNDFTGKYGRMLTGALTGWQRADEYWGMFALPNAAFAQVRSMWLNGVMATVMLAKVPPFPPPDSIDRSNYVPVPIALKPPAGVDNVVVQFGYAENGSTGSYYCTTRQETCVANAASITQVTPFRFPSEGTGGILSGLAGLSCASGCTVLLPGISQRVLYYQVLYRDASNAVVATGAPSVASVP